MSECKFTIQASQDLDEIFNYIAQDNPTAAARWVYSLEEKCRMLSGTPNLGRRRHDLAPSLRGFPVGNYVIFYRPMPGGIEILRVLHGARDIPAQFE